jgi:hypothetical protein
MKRVNTSLRGIATSHEESEHFFTITLKEVFTLCMTGYNYTKRSVHSLHGWVQLH